MISPSQSISFIVDTSVAFFEGADENSNTEALAHALRLRGLTELAGGPCVIVLLVASGILLEPGPGPFAAGVTAFLFSSGTAFFVALEFLLQGRLKKKKRK